MRVEKPFRTLVRLLVLRSPVEAQLIVTRRCNLSCGYCYEYDNTSAPVPIDDLRRRIDSLHRLKVIHITLLGGEPLMHPNVADVVRYGRRHSTVSITTNGFLLSERMVVALNDAGLNHMQVSIDSTKVDPTNFIQKSLKQLRPKLERLKKLATFDVHLAAVLCPESKNEVDDLIRQAKDLDVPISLNILHDERGAIGIAGDEYVGAWDSYYQKAQFFPLNMIDFDYNRRLLAGDRPSWHCRAGARALYVDEFGYVEFCHAQRGRLHKPVEEYTMDDIRTNSRTLKGCERGCAVACVYRASEVDNCKTNILKTFVRGFNRNLFRPF